MALTTEPWSIFFPAFLTVVFPNMSLHQAPHEALVQRSPGRHRCSNMNETDGLYG